MSDTNDRRVVREILETALGDQLTGVENPTRGEVEKWDSLVHMEIVFMLEDAFGVRFSEDEIARLGSEVEITECVRGKAS
jgi:acyl carrier protein